MKKKFDIMNHVDILDQVKVIVTQPMPGNFAISFEPYDVTKQVIIDSSAHEAMNQQITEKAGGRSAKDPNTVEYIKEFAGKLLSELFRTQLAILEEIKDAPKDPYESFRRKFTSK